MDVVMEQRETSLKHAEVFHKLALLSQVMSKRVKAAAQSYFDKDLEYILSFQDKSKEELSKERKRLDKLLH